MKIALVGIGKIALDQHVPAIAASPDWELAATVSRSGTVNGVEAFTDFSEFLTARPEVEAVSLCLPPVPRYAYAEAALAAGRHLMLEKPPGATLAECTKLQIQALDAVHSCFFTWHSRMAPGVQPAAEWLANKTINAVRIVWREDVRRWHPGQDWVFEPGGMGVFDPGINALSIMTHILTRPVHLIEGVTEVPKGRQTPIAARLTFTDNVTADFDWRQEGPQTWEITVETDQGALILSEGGAKLSIAGQDVDLAGKPGEYPALYAHFAELVKRGHSDTDLAPMVHVSDAMTVSRREIVEPFSF